MRLWRRKKKECRVASRPRWTRPALADGLLINCAGEERGFTRPRVLSTCQPIRPLQRKGVTRIRPNAANATQSGSPGRACRQGPRITSRWTGVLFSPVTFFLLKNHDRPQLPLRDWSISNLFFLLASGWITRDGPLGVLLYVCMHVGGILLLGTFDFFLPLPW